MGASSTSSFGETDTTGPATPSTSTGESADVRLDFIEQACEDGATYFVPGATPNNGPLACPGLAVSDANGSVVLAPDELAAGEDALLLRPPNALQDTTSVSASYNWVRVPEGARVMGFVSCSSEATTCDLQARILFDTAESVNVELLHEVDLARSSEPTEVDVPLFELEGQLVRFILQARANTSDDAVAAWSGLVLVVP